MEDREKMTPLELAIKKKNDGERINYCDECENYTVVDLAGFCKLDGKYIHPLMVTRGQGTGAAYNCKNQVKRKVPKYYVSDDPCSICENFIYGTECDVSDTCPVGKMKKTLEVYYLKNLAMDKEMMAVKEQIKSDAGWDFENSIKDKIYEMGEC